MVFSWRFVKRIELLEAKQLKLSNKFIVHLEQKMLFKLIRGLVVLEWQRADRDCLLNLVTHLDMSRQSVAAINILDEHEANEIIIFIDDLVDQDFLIGLCTIPRQEASNSRLKLDDCPNVQLLLNLKWLNFLTNVEV